MSMGHEDRYLEAVEQMADGFRYENCAECGEDLDRHAIVPGVFGLPFALCLTADEDDRRADLDDMVQRVQSRHGPALDALRDM